MFKNTKISYRLGIGFGLLILILASLAVFGINRMNLLSRQTTLMYDHPLTVSNAVLRINTNIIKIHRSMKDVALAHDMACIEESSRIVDNHEEEVYEDFDIINKRFLGEKEKYKKALKVFTEWKAIRDEVISLMHAGKNLEAANITKSKGAIHVSKIEKAMESLGDFAQSKAEDFYSTARVVKHGALNMMYLLVTVSIVLGIVFAIILTKSITTPIAIMRNATTEVGMGNLDTKIVVRNKDEIGELADAFNKMTTGLREVTASHDELDKEITERKQAENALKESEGKTLLLLNSTGEAIYGLDLEGNCTFCNPSCLRLLGYENESQLLSRNMHALIHHTKKDGTPYPEEECCIYQAFREGKGTHVDDEVFWRADGTSFAAEYRSFPIFHGGGTVGSVVSFVDITERKQAEEELLIKERQYREIFESSLDALIIFDLNGVIKEANPAACKMYGYSYEEMTGLYGKDIVHPDYYYLFKMFVEKTTSGEAFSTESVDIRKDGFLFNVDVRGSFYEYKGEPHILAIVRDITERKQAEEQIKASLKEKEVLLMEIHHRVKNNMQVIASLLRLQSEGIKDKHLLDLFNESRNRIKSMALVHEDLYQNKNLASIAFDQYTRKLTGRLMKSFGVDPNRIITSINIDNVFLGVDKAIPCGLIINELFTNSLKYAFPHIITDVEHILEEDEDRERSKNKGEICINLHSNNDEYTLVFSDNGVGLPKDIDFHKAKTLGLELVRTLVKQLKGTIKLNRSGGAEFKITFRV